jgi:hypothetical protein
LLGTRSYALGTGLYYSFEGKITTHDTAGSFEVRVDGLNRLSGANVDTKASGNASANGIAFGDNIGGSNNGQQDFYIDNLYTCDGQGATTASRRIAVDSYPPAADGAHSGLAPSSGMTHFSLVDETTPNEDADYNENATLEAKESYGFADMAYNPARRFGVQINLSVEKDDAGFHQTKDVVRSSGTDCAGVAQAVSTSRDPGQRDDRRRTLDRRVRRLDHGAGRISSPRCGLGFRSSGEPRDKHLEVGFLAVHEYLDHPLFWNGTDRECKLLSYRDHYNHTVVTLA